MTELFQIENFDVYLIVGIVLFFSLLEMIAGYWHSSKRNFGDWIQEAGGFLVLGFVIKPLVLFAVLGMMELLLSEYRYVWRDWPVALMAVVYILVDDFCQYWYHRLAHQNEWLWKLHRPHHQAEEMGFFVAYRNAGLYFVMIPNLWLAAIFTFLGGAIGVAIATVLKQVVVISSHSLLKWDEWFYKRPALHPLMTVLERIFITPAFHHAHHGRSMLDGIGDPNGNFGNMFSIWDQVFGTAIFTRQFPTDYGLINDPKEHWSVAYFYPILTSKDPQSELNLNYSKEKTATLTPANIQLEAGKPYLWCACGKSKNQPFCNGSHQGSTFKPVRFVAEKSAKVKLCNCKQSQNPPFCDFTHLNLK